MGVSEPWREGVGMRACGVGEVINRTAIEMKLIDVSNILMKGDKREHLPEERERARAN